MNDLVSRLRDTNKTDGLEQEAADRIEWDIQLDESRCKRIAELEAEIDRYRQGHKDQAVIIQHEQNLNSELTLQSRRLEQSLVDAMKRINQQYDIIQQRNQRIFELTNQLREILEVMPDLWTDERIAAALGNARKIVGGGE